MLRQRREWETMQRLHTDWLSACKQHLCGPSGGGMHMQLAAGQSRAVWCLQWGSTRGSGTVIPRLKGRED